MSLQTTISNFYENGRKFSKRVEKTGKRRNCSLWAISPFPTVFSKTCTADMCKQEIVWERVKQVGTKIIDELWKHYILQEKSEVSS